MALELIDTGQPNGASNPYKIESEDDYLEIPIYDSDIETKYFQLQNDIALVSALPRWLTFYGDFDLNKKKLSNVDIGAGRHINDCYGSMHDGVIEFAASASETAYIAFIKTYQSSSYFENVHFTGVIENTGNGDATLLNTVQFSASPNIVNCRFDTDLIAGGDCFQAGGSNGANIENILVTSTHTAGVNNYAFMPFSANVNNSFYDTDKNPGATAFDITGKTTNELNQIATYNDTVNTAGLETAWDIALKSNHNGNIESGVWKIDDGNAYPEFYFIPTVAASGSVQFNDVAFSNGVVDFFSAPSPTGTLTLVDSDVAINSGVATMTTERDPLKDYFGVARGMTQDFTGTLASAPAGDVISTGLDLTGISIGGDNDNHFVFRATGGTGAGTEVTVKSRNGGDITVTDASAFATGTEFTLGRFVRGVSRVFPKD